MFSFYMYRGGGDIIPYKVVENRGKYWRHIFFMFEKPRQFSRQSEFYYACLDWRETDFNGRKYWLADIPATGDPERDYAKVDRVLRYLGRSKMKWQVLTANQISPVHRMPNGEGTDYCGKVVLDTWLRDNVKQ